MKKTRVIFLALFIILLVSAWLFLPKKPPQETTPPPKPTLVGDPPIMEFVPGAPKNVRFSIESGATVRLPSLHQTYAVVPLDPEPLAYSFAARTGFTNPASVSHDSTKKTVWKSATGSLSFTKNGRIGAISFRNDAGYQVTQGSQQQAAEEYLRLLLGAEAKNYSLFSQQILSESSTEGGSAIKAGAVMFLFSYSVGGVPVLVANFDPVSASVIVGSDGKILYSSTTFPPGTLSLRSNQASVSIENIVASLNANKGVLLSSYDDASDEYGEEPVFSAVNISRSTGVLYYDSEASLLIPGLLIDGTGTSATKNQVVQYFIRATE